MVMQINMEEQINKKEQLNSSYDFSEIYSKGLEDIIATCELRRNIGLISSFKSEQLKNRNQEELNIYMYLVKFIKKNVYDYHYQEIILNKIAFLFQYGKITKLEVEGDMINIIGAVNDQKEDSSSYALEINIDEEKIKISSNCVLGSELLTNNIKVTYKTIPQDDMKEYVEFDSSHIKKYYDIDSWYFDEVKTKNLLSLKEENGNIITALKRRNTKETTTLLCGSYQGFNGDRVIKEHKKSVTEWNGIGKHIGYVIGSYSDSIMEYGQKIAGEEYYYASRNNSPTLCDIIPDSIKVPLNFLEFNAALAGVTLEKSTPISTKIMEAENEYTFGTLKKIEKTKPFA